MKNLFVMIRNFFTKKKWERTVGKDCEVEVVDKDNVIIRF